MSQCNKRRNCEKRNWQ